MTRKTSIVPENIKFWRYIPGENDVQLLGPVY